MEIYFVTFNFHKQRNIHANTVNADITLVYGEKLLKYNSADRSITSNNLMWVN